MQISNKFSEISKLYEQEKNNLHNLEVNNETKKVKISNLITNIESSNNELKSMSGNIELLRTNNESPDNKLSQLEENLEGNLKVQNIKDLELKEVRVKITELTNKISSLDKNSLDAPIFEEITGIPDILASNKAFGIFSQVEGNMKPCDFLKSLDISFFDMS